MSGRVDEDSYWVEGGERSSYSTVSTIIKITRFTKILKLTKFKIKIEACKIIVIVFTSFTR